MPSRVEPGWQATISLRRPHGSANPHGFDYEAWLLERGIRATGYVRPAPSGVRERFRRALGDAPHAGVLVALAIGDQRAIAADDWQCQCLVPHLCLVQDRWLEISASTFTRLQRVASISMKS